LTVKDKEKEKFLEYLLWNYVLRREKKSKDHGKDNAGVTERVKLVTQV